MHKIIFFFTKNKKIDDLLESYKYLEEEPPQDVDARYIIIATEKKLKEGFRIRLRRS